MQILYTDNCLEICNFPSRRVIERKRPDSGSKRQLALSDSERPSAALLLSDILKRRSRCLDNNTGNH